MKIKKLVDIQKSFFATQYLRGYEKNCELLSEKIWRTPIVGYADVNHPYIW